ncbi:unnamed protein product, partial [Scytosiphon promiscuus]
LPGISGWPPSPRGQVLAPFCTSAKPFHATASFASKPATTGAARPPPTPSLPIPLPAPTTCGAAPVPADRDGVGNTQTKSTVAGKPPLPLPTTTAVAPTATMDAVAARAPPCEMTYHRSSGAEEGATSGTAKTAFLSHSPPPASTSPAGGAHTAWSPSPPRTAARHPLKPIHLRRRLLHAPEGEDSRCSIGSHARRRTVSDMATVAAAPEGGALSMGAPGARGPAEETTKRPGLRRRRSSSSADGSLSRCQCSAIKDNKRDEQGRGTAALKAVTCPEVSCLRSPSSEPTPGTSTEPRQGAASDPFLHRRSSNSSPGVPRMASSRNESYELGPPLVREASHSKREKAPLVEPSSAPPAPRGVSTSPSHTTSLTSDERGLRAFPLQRSNSVSNVSGSDPNDESCAAGCFLGGSLGSDGAWYPPSPLICCSPPVLAKLDCVPHSSGQNKMHDGVRGDDQNLSLASGVGRYGRHSPHSLGGRSDAESPRLCRQNSYFDKRTPATAQGPSPTERKPSGKVVHDREPPEGQDRPRRSSRKSGCGIPCVNPGTTDCSAFFPQVHPPAASAAGLPDRPQSSVDNLLGPDEEHGRSASDHRHEELHRHLSPVSKARQSATPTMDKPLTSQPLSGSSEYFILDETTHKRGTCNEESSAEHRRFRPLDREGSSSSVNKVDQLLGASNRGGSGGGSPPVSSSDGAGGTAARTSFEAPSLLIRRNDSILKSLLTGSAFDPVVGFPQDVHSAGASYEFGLWKRKSTVKDPKAGHKILSPSLCPLLAAPAIAKREGIRIDAELPPPPLKGLATNARSTNPFSQAVKGGIGAYTVRRACHRVPREVPIMAQPCGQERAELDDRQISPRSPSYARAVGDALRDFAKIPARQSLRKTQIDYADSCTSRSTIPRESSIDSAEHARDVACSPSPLVSIGGDSPEGLRESSSLSSSGSSLCSSLRGSPPPEIPSPSPLPSPRQSPRLSPRAARAGTRPCEEAKAYPDERPRSGRSKEGDTRQVRGLKASPPLVASRFPLTSHVWIRSGGNQSLRTRGRREQGKGSCRGDKKTSRSLSTGGGGASGGGETLSDGGGLGSSSVRDEGSPPVGDDVAISSTVPTSTVSLVFTDAELGEETLLFFPHNQAAKTSVPCSQKAVANAFQETATNERDGDGSFSPTTRFSWFEQETQIPSPTEDPSDFLTVEISAGHLSIQRWILTSDSHAYGHGSQWVADKGCHAGVLLRARRNAIHWKRGEEIGMGSFGKVFKGLNESTGELFAVKQISLKRGLQDDITTLEAEIDLMKDLDHRHIVRYCGTDRGTRHLYIFLEYVPGGSIASMLEQFGLFREDLVRRFMHQILLGMQYLHEKGIIHRDVKGANVLVTEQGIAKLADFGCSKQFHGVRTPSFDESLHTIRGSIPWMAPEMIKQTGHGRSADVWSVGATMIEMYTARYPWPPFSNSIAAMYHVATATEPPAFPDTASLQATDFLSKCLIIDPDKRLKASELLQHPFLLVAAAELEASSGHGPGGFGATDGAAELHLDTA